jgi:hypothetical protein
MRTGRSVIFVVAVALIIGLVTSLTGVSYLATASSAVGGTTSSAAPSVVGSVALAAVSGGYKETLTATYGDHVVISEFATKGPPYNGGSGAYNEFVELYNPTNAAVNIENWKIGYYSATWTDNYVTTFQAGATIASCGFYLWGNNNTGGYGGSGDQSVVAADYYSNCFGLSNGTSGAPRAIRLKNADNTVIDTVGYEVDGGTTWAQAEGSLTAPNGGTVYDNISVERKANANSTADTLKVGGVDENKGNNYDTNVNANDWVRQTNGRHPQNSASPLEIPDNICNAIIVTFSHPVIENLKGTTSTFNVNIKNTYASGHTLNLTITDNIQGWPISPITPTPVYVAANGGENSATFTGTILADALIFAADTITVTATAQDNAQRTDSGTCTLKVGRLAPTDNLYPTDDTELAEESPDNSGSGTTRIGARTHDNGLNHRSYIKFDLSGLPAGTVIYDAVLRLYEYSSAAENRIAGVSDHEVKRVSNDAWAENTLTWNTANSTYPMDGYVNSGDNSRSTIITEGTYQYKYMDVTAYVKASLDNNDPLISLALKAQVENYDNVYRWGYYDTKEYATQADWPELELRIAPSVQFTFRLRAGWNMISFPVMPDNKNPHSIFPGDYTMFKWNAAGKQYVLCTDDNIENGVGYWFYVSAAENVLVSGTPVNSLALPLSAGWNLIGSPLGGASIASPDDTPDGSVLPYAFTWDAENRKYTPPITDLVAGAGYWVYALNSCVLRLGGG